MTNPAPEPLSVSELIAIGRDREAVEVATRAARQRSRADRDDPATSTGGPMDGVQQLDRIIPQLERLVDNIGPDALGRATPCAGFDVAGVLEHMIGGASAFAPAFRGEAGAEAGAGPDGSVQDRWRAAIRDLADAVHSDGAQERTIASPFGEVPGSTFARYVAFDGLVHGWDLATATGQPYAPDDALVEEVAEFARGLLQPEMRDGDTFAAETTAPADASPLQQLVAFSGRRIIP